MNRCHAIRGLALVLFLTLSSGCGLAEISPTTGLETDKPYRPVLVNINSIDGAWPAWGLSDADIIYESIIWGPGYTRCLALFNDRHPERVGPLRGTRAYQWEWREEWDCPFVYRGGQTAEGTSYHDFIEQHGVNPLMCYDGVYTNKYNKQAAAIFSRLTERVSPHNGVADLTRVVEDLWPKDPETGKPYEPRLPNWQFSETPTQGSDMAQRIDILYPSGRLEDQYSAHIIYTFDKDARHYQRHYNGQEDYDLATGAKITVSNVIVQYNKLAYYEGDVQRPVLTTTGTGAFDAFIGGAHIRGTWRRPEVNSQTEYLDENGEPLVLLPGKTFIQILPPAWEIHYLDMEGALHTATGV